MVKFDTKKILRNAEVDYERTWMETAKLLRTKGKCFDIVNKAKEHPLITLAARARKVLLKLGFTETIVPMIIEKDEIYRQYGPEAPVILDRVFFLAGLSRPDVGIGQKKVKEIKEIVPDFKKTGTLQDIFSRYKRGEIAADDLVETIVKELEIEEEQATEILSRVFPELIKLKPIPSNLTLRSHTTAGWFTVLRKVQERETLPIQLFSIGTKFRREQKLDPTHLYDSLTASIAIMTEEMSLEDGKRIAAKILNKLGFKQINFAKKVATSKYYAPQTEFEVYVEHPTSKESIEIGDAGFYSPISLSKYDIPYPVWNFGFGLERLLMVMTGKKDIRELVFPYLYEKVEFSDIEIANSFKMVKKPTSKEGKKLVDVIVDAASKHASDPSPLKLLIYRGEFLNKQIEVRLVKNEPNKKLLGPAALNLIVVKDGSIIGAIPDKIPENSTMTSFSYIRGIANQAVYVIESAVKKTRKKVLTQVKNVKSLTDVNLEINPNTRRYIRSSGKRIYVVGPVFVWISTKIFKRTPSKPLPTFV